MFKKKITCHVSKNSKSNDNNKFRKIKKTKKKLLKHQRDNRLKWTKNLMLRKDGWN